MDSEIYFFWTGYKPILRIIIVGTITYLGIIILMRFAGKRTFANMNSLDFIITVAIGSAYGRILTAREVTVSEAIAAFALLVTIKFVLTEIEVYIKKLSSIITPDPVLLFYRGTFYDNRLKKERLRRDDVLVQMRKQSIKSIDDVEAIILESDGKFSVIRKSGEEDNITYKELC